MEELYSLIYVLSELTHRSKTILEEGVEILDNFNPLVDQVLSIQTHLRRDHVQKIIHEEIVNLICDAQHTQNEIKGFATCLSQGKQVKADTCPFLAKVWYGDLYGTAGKEGLHDLLDDLNKQSYFLKENRLVEKIMEYI